jgi:hypothetical protein
MTSEDELAALKARVAALERTAKPSEPFKPDPNWRPVNPLDRLSMPRSVMQEMANAVPDGVVRDIVAKGTIPGPSGAGASGDITRAHPGGGAANVPGSGTGWQNERPFVRADFPAHPTPGVAAADRIMDAADKADRVELAQRLAAQKAALKR